MPGRCRMRAQKRAISSELAPRSSKKWSLGGNMVDLQHLGQGAGEEVLAVRLGGDQLGAGRDARPLRLRQLPVVGLVADRHRDGRQFLEIGRHHVGRQPASQRLGDLAARQDRCVLLERIVGHELDPCPARARRWSPPPARSPASPAARIRSR